MQMFVEVEVEVAHCPSRTALQLQLQLHSFESVVEWCEGRAGSGSHPDAYEVQQMRTLSLAGVKRSSK
jgi:hypothetical protein